MLPPPRPKMPFTYVVNVYSDMSLFKGHLGSGGGEASKNKPERHQFHLSIDKRHNFRCTHAQKEYGKVLEMKSTYILNILALLFFLKFAMHLLKIWS